MEPDLHVCEAAERGCSRKLTRNLPLLVTINALRCLVGLAREILIESMLVVAGVRDRG